MVWAPWQGASTWNAGKDSSVAAGVAPRGRGSGSEQLGSAVVGMYSTVADLV
jgi:lipid-binding SYLF domain-containing protein